jgi:hypothetical protein
MGYHLTRRQAQKGVEHQTGGVAESSVDKAALSIRLRPDGFSFASGPSTDGAVIDVAFDEGHYPENLKQALREAIPDAGHTSVRVSLPAADAVLVPSEYDREETRNFLFPDAEALKRKRVSVRCGDKTLMMTVPAELDAFFREEYGERFEWCQPLAVSLDYADTASVLRIDTTADRWFACLTLKGQLAAAESFPLENEASLLLGINRLIVIHKAGALKIVCSGERCEEHVATLATYYPDVSVDPDGADRDIIRLLR